MPRFALVVLLYLSAAATILAFQIDPDFENVSVGSVVRLANVASLERLHSHQIAYGTGSHSQSVTAIPNPSDPGSFWAVFSVDQDLPRGSPIKCNSLVIIQHQSSKKYLHSSHGVHQSPLSGNGEVNAMERRKEDVFYSNSEDDIAWEVKCHSKYWKREENVRFQHPTSGAFLSSSVKYKYPQPINGQSEVCTKKDSSTSESEWKALEGFYFSLQQQ